MEGDKFDFFQDPQLDEYYLKYCRQRNYHEGKFESLGTKMVLTIVPMLVVPAEL